MRQHHLKFKIKRYANHNKQNEIGHDHISYFTYFLIQKDKKMSIKQDTITSFFLPFSCLFFFSNEIHRNAGQDDLNARIAFPSLICILFYLKKGNNF